MSALGSAGTGNTFAVTEGKALGGLDSVAALLADKASSFGILYTTTQGGQDYYYLGQVFTFDTSSSSYNPTTSTFTATSTSAPPQGNAGAWTAVPEPSSAALALAGLALLLKRRKA